MAHKGINRFSFKDFRGISALARVALDCEIRDFGRDMLIGLLVAGSGMQPWQQFHSLAESSRVSPTVLQSGPYRFFFFSSDRNEPVHVHVKRDHKLAKFWLAPVRLTYNYGFSQTELNRIAGIVRQHEAELSKAWHDYFKRGHGSGESEERSSH